MNKIEKSKAWNTNDPMTWSCHEIEANDKILSIIVSISYSFDKQFGTVCAIYFTNYVYGQEYIDAYAYILCTHVLKTLKI